MAKLADLFVKLGFKDKEFKSGISRAKKSAQGFGSAMKKVGAIAAGAFAFTKIIQGVKQFVSANAQFEQSLASLSAITGATGKELEFYKEKAIELGAKTTLSAQEVAKAFELMGSAKPELLANKEALASVTEEAITLAEAAGLDLPTATAALAKTMNQFNKPASDAGKVINILAAGSKAGAEAIPGISDAIKVMGTSANMAGISLEQSVGAIETLAEKGLSGAESGTQLRNVILKLQSEADEFNPKVVGLSKALENLGKENLNAAELTKMFGLQNQQAAAILIQNRDKMEKYTEAVTDTNVAYDQQAKQTNTLIGSWKSFQSAIEGVMLSFSESNGIIKKLVDGVTNFINSFREGGGIGQIKAWITGFIDQNQHLFKVFGWLKDIVKELFAFSIAMFKNALNGLLEIANALIQTYNESENFRKALGLIKTAFTAIWEVGKALFQSLQDGFLTLVKWISTGFKGDVWDKFWQETKDVWKKATVEIADSYVTNQRKALEAKPISFITLPTISKTKKGAKDLAEATAKEFNLALEESISNSKLDIGSMLTKIKGGGKLPTDPNAEARDMAKASIQQLNDDLNSILTEGVMMTIDLLGQGLEDIASGDFDIKDFGKSALQTVGTFIKMFGEALVAYGISISAFKDAFGNPALAIGVGLAAIALGSVLSGLGSSAPSTSGGGSSGGGGGEAGQLAYLENNNQILTATVTGDDLLFVLNRTNKKNSNV